MLCFSLLNQVCILSDGEKMACCAEHLEVMNIHLFSA